MTINEIFSYENGIFSVFKEVLPTDFAVLFPDTDPLLLDYRLIDLYGNRICNAIVESHKDDETITLTSVFRIRLSSWKRIFDALNLDYQVNTPYNITETKTGTENKDITETTTDTDSTRAFNSTDFKDTDKNNRASTGANTVKYDVTTTRKGNTGEQVQRLISAEIEMRKTAFANIVIRDIINDITLPIYQ